MTDRLENGFGIQAIDVEQHNRRYQNAVISGCAVSAGSGTLEVDVTSGEAVVAGTRHSVGATTLQLAQSAGDPRKDLIYIDSSGTPAVATGTPAPAQPGGETRRDTYQPAPPDLSQTDACVLAEVWVGADVNDITDADISDRRLDADLTVGDLDADAINTADSITVTEGEATDTLHYGRDQDRANAGDESVALGIGARANGDDGNGNNIGRHSVVGYLAAQNNTGFGVTAAGYQAAQTNTGDRVTAAGYLAARNNTGDRVTAAGYQAAQTNTGDRVTAAGYLAAQTNTGFGVTAAGYLAARNNTGDRVTAAGYRAARNNTGDRVTAAGYQAARGDGLADPTTMGDDNIGIGRNAIRNNQASGLIAIGQDAGINAQTDDQLIITDRNGNRRMTMDLTTGNLNIEGSLTENATL